MGCGGFEGSSGRGLSQSSSTPLKSALFRPEPSTGAALASRVQVSRGAVGHPRGPHGKHPLSHLSWGWQIRTGPSPSGANCTGTLGPSQAMSVRPGRRSSCYSPWGTCPPLSPGLSPCEAWGAWADAAQGCCGRGARALAPGVEKDGGRGFRCHGDLPAGGNKAGPRAPVRSTGTGQHGAAPFCLAGTQAVLGLWPLPRHSAQLALAAPPLQIFPRPTSGTVTMGSTQVLLLPLRGPDGYVGRARHGSHSA